METLGSLRVDENIYPIVRIELVPGGITFIARARGPMSAASGKVRVFAPTGQAVTDHFEGVSHVDLPQMYQGDDLTFQYTWELESINKFPHTGHVTLIDNRRR
jgi:hypothetical protein